MIQCDSCDCPNEATLTGAGYYFCSTTCAEYVWEGTEHEGRKVHELREEQYTWEPDCMDDDR